MKQGGKGTITIVVVLILVAALAALVGYSKLSANNDGDIDLEGKIAGISKDQGTIGLVSDDGSFDEIPGNAVIAGINRTEMDLVKEFLKNQKDINNTVYQSAADIRSGMDPITFFDDGNCYVFLS